MKNKIDLLVFIVFISFLFGLVLFFNMPKSASNEDSKFLIPASVKNTDNSQDRQRVFVKMAQPSLMRPETIIYGRVVAQKNVSIQSRSNLINQFVKSVFVASGDFVNKGEVLFEIDSEDLQRKVQKQQINILKIKTNIALLKLQHQQTQERYEFQKEKFQIDEINWSRALKLYQSDALTKAEIEAREQAFINSKTALNDLKYQIDIVGKNIQLTQQDLNLQNVFLDEVVKDLDAVRIKAPFSGRVTNVHISEGDRVSGQSLLNMYDLKSLEVKVDLPFRLRKLFQGKDRDLIQLSFENQNFRLKRISSDLDSKTANLYGFFEFSHNNYVVGDLLEMKMVLPQEDHLIAIDPGVVYEGSKIYRIRNGQSLESVQCMNKGYQFLEGALSFNETHVLLNCPSIKNGDDILNTPLPRAYNGMKVKIVN